MLPSKINTFKQSFRMDSPEGFTREAAEAFLSLLSALRPIALQFLPDTCTKQDFEDAESDAILNGIKYIMRVLKNKPESKHWSKTEWRRRIGSRFSNAILESSRYLLFPMNIPRPLRFSLKKYSEALLIIRKYAQEEHLHNSTLYHALFDNECSMSSATTCQECTLGLKTCPILDMDEKDMLQIHSLLSGARKSLTYYGKMYRKSYHDWVRILEAVKSLAASSLLSPDREVSPDLDKYIVLKELRKRMADVHPHLFEIYCYALSDVDINKLNTTYVVQTPKGWLNKDIKDKFGIESYEFRSLLEKGDAILNEFRSYERLPPIQRRFWSKSTQPSTLSQNY